MEYLKNVQFEIIKGEKRQQNQCIYFKGIIQDEHVYFLC